MLTTYNRIQKNSIAAVLISALILSGLFSFPNTVYADKVVLSEQTYYHLDMGVQLAYNPGSPWGTYFYGTTEKDLTATIRFNSDVEVIDAYPLESSKGSAFDFNGSTSSHNIPSSFGRGDSAYITYYQNHVSSSMAEGDCSSSGKNVTFSYDAKLNTPTPLEVVSYGEDERDDDIWRLFGGKDRVQNPMVKAAIENALLQGHNGTAGSNKLYLVFCPTVIEYKKYITVGELEAQLDLPTSAKQDEAYTVSDASLVDSSLTVDQATLEKHDGDGNWLPAAVWNGMGVPGENTGGSIDESCDEICTITYRLTVTTIDGQTDTDIKTIQITDGREIDGEAILELPAYTYEGHPVLATDHSEFEVDGVGYSARRAYEEKVATNRFRPLPSGSGSASKQSLTTANVVFPVRGNYNVRLEVSTADGKELTDTKPIEVRKTPYIIDNLGGFQKQNRKQLLSISVATSPGKPIVDYYVVLRDLKTGQEITLTQDKPQENNATIKTRAITTGGDQYWTEYRLEFLTKTPAYDPDHPEYTQDFRYTIYMMDSKGDTDTVQKTFTVRPDMPPDAQILIQDSFIRNKGTNIAEIQTEDSSTTDGDQLQRIWTVNGINIESLPGFKDNSFNSRQKVQYSKTGVGREEISLHVKDVWTEPTLEEYITAADYLSSSTIAETEVINIAPTVRLEPKETETADVIIMTEKASESGIKAGINSIKASLIEAGIDANVQLIPTAKPNTDGYHRVGYYEWKVAINDQPQRSTGLVFDSEYAYVVEAAGFEMGGAGSYQEVCIPPYTVKALKKSETGSETLVPAWSYTVTDSTNFGLKTDSLEKYIYLTYVDKGKTVLLNRKNGAYVTTLPVVIPDHAYTTTQNNNLYFLSDNKIQKYDPNTGTLKTVIDKGGTLGRVQNGKITFVGKESGSKFYIGQFDINTETLSYKSIPKLEEYPQSSLNTGYGLSAVTPTDMDTTGKVTFAQTIIDSYNDRRGVIIWMADSESNKVYSLGRTNTMDMRKNSFGFVKDETGKAVYMYHGISDDDSTSTTTRRYFHLYVYTLGDGDTLPVKRTIYSEKNNRLNWTEISYAKYHSQEDAIYIMQGNAWQSSDWNVKAQGVQCRIQLPSWTASFNQYNWGWDVADEEGRYNDHMMMTYFDYESWVDGSRRLKMFHNSITKDQAEESALARLADYAFDSARVIEKNFVGVQELTNKVKQAVKETASVKITAGKGVETSLTRNFTLVPGETYFYEYEAKSAGAGSVHNSFNIKPSFQNVYAGNENIGEYYVTDIVEEDFNDQDINPFFTGVSGMADGKLKTAPASSGSYRWVSTKSEISFTVPAGKKVVVQADVYNLLDENGTNTPVSGWRSGIYVDGKRYRGTYTSTVEYIKDYIYEEVLGPGKHKITVESYRYTKGGSEDYKYSSIDNLKVIFIDKNPTSQGSKDENTQNLEDGWVKTSGSFKLPNKIIKFGSQQASHFEMPPGMVVDNPKNKRYYDFTVEPGKAAFVRSVFYVDTNDGRGPTFRFAGILLNSYSSTGTPTVVLNGSNLFMGTFEGTNRFEVTYSSYNGTDGSLTNMNTWVTDSNLKDNKQVFFEGDGAYLPAESFSGDTELKMSFGGANGEGILLKNLKIYYMKDGKRIYLQNAPLKEASELAYWQPSAGVSVESYWEEEPEKEEDAPLVYKKGQLISYNIFYDDYESDPSKKQYWRYTHTPYNDGPHPDAAFILNEDGVVVSSTGAILAEPIPRFYIDGKYTVEHWQEDNTNRTGDTSGETDYTKYDKLSNVESIPFYVEGGATAPWITSIKTIPGSIKEGSSYRLQIGVDDLEKDELRLTTELYLDKKRIYMHKESGITADASGNYPYITTGTAPLAVAGKYEVVCTVRDWSGVGIGTYKFTVVSEGRITGSVSHTPQWDENRKKYNMKRFSDEINRTSAFSDYIALPAPRPRGTNVFWSGEKFMLFAETEGSPSEVSVHIKESNPAGGFHNTVYSTTLEKTDLGNGKTEQWQGSLWDRTMINRWGRKQPEELLFVFTAAYTGGMTKNHQVRVIIDSDRDYWQLHRLW